MKLGEGNAGMRNDEPGAKEKTGYQDMIIDTW
jgi:hypothetical protein